jgi:hypothetical protein
MAKRNEVAPSDAVSIEPAQICFIIVKAREFDAKVAPEDPKSGSNPTDDLGVGALEDSPGDPTLEELAGAIGALNSDQQVELLALCWLGRGDYTAAEWDQAMDEARATRDRNLVHYLVSTPLLGDYLEEGYNQLGYSCEDVELGRL